MDQYSEEIVKEQEVENKDGLRKILEKLVEATEKGRSTESKTHIRKIYLREIHK